MRALNLSQIEETQTRDNFSTLEKEFKGNPILNGEWRFFDREFTAIGSYRITHKLGFKPLDLITTYSTATVTVDLANASNVYVDITVTAIGRIRFLLGRMS